MAIEWGDPLEHLTNIAFTNKKDSYINSITYYCYNNWYFIITKKDLGLGLFILQTI